MTSSLHDDVVLEISSQILTTESGGVGGGTPSRGGMYSGSVELGRRLLLAARNGDTQQVLDLMAKGAPFTTDWLGTSTLHLAAGGAHLGTCAVLLRAGVSREARTKVERTPLHVAAHSGHAAVCALLLDNGAQVDCRDMLQMTPLHWACARGHADTAALLLRHGADPDARSKFHKSPRALAAAAGRSDLLALMDDALRQREAASSVDALKQAHTDEQMKEITEAEQQRALESIERLQETVKPPQKQQAVHTEPIKIGIERPPTEHQQPTSAEQNSGLAAQLLQKHGITLLPQDDTSTVLNAIQSGRTVVLSDAGKLMLKESSSTTFPPNGNAGNNTSKGVILTAAPVKSPLKPGVKIFTLNNTLLAMPKENKLTKKVINPHDMQIKLLSLPADTKLVSSSKVPMKAKSRLRPAPSPWPSAVGTGNRVAAAAVGGRPAVKIIVNKANFSKMLAGKGVLENGIQLKTNTMTPELSKVVQPSAAATTAPQSGAGQSGGSGSASLAAQLAAARRDILELTAQLDTLKQRLALYEPV